MATAVNAAKARLKKNQLAVGIGIRLVRNVDIIKVMKAAGYDWLFLDLEHGVMSIETAAEICVAAQDSGIAPIVRVPYGELAMATRLLDGGALTAFVLVWLVVAAVGFVVHRPVELHYKYKEDDQTRKGFEGMSQALGLFLGILGLLARLNKRLVGIALL